jgi:hypothetical protein
MEPITNTIASLPPKESEAIAGMAFANFDGEMQNLIAMTKSEKLPIPGLGEKVDIMA